MYSLKTAAIYARKSKQTETGDSIENQIKICSNYLQNIGIENTLIYKDEGFSGKNTVRPEFLKMLKDVKQKKFTTIISYRLDRISRNVSDFSKLITDLEELNISFISVVEQFDTSNAMGKAMMYICSVFSQLERETITQRVKDNMYGLAENGYWLGGEPPTGFKSQHDSFVDASSNTRAFSILSPIDNELALVKLVYTEYLNRGSLSQVEKYMLSNNIKTKNEKDWSKGTLRSVLSSPAYVRADDTTVDYLKNLGITIYGLPDKIHGILNYRRRIGKSGKFRSPDKWIYAMSSHEGIIDADIWLRVQLQLEKNKTKSPALGTSHTALLSGIIRCEKCNSFMKIAYAKESLNSGQKTFYYKCSLKHNSGKTRCDNKNVNGVDLDRMLLNKLKEIALDKTILIRELEKYKSELHSSSKDIIFKDLQQTFNKNTGMINNLINNVALTNNTDTASTLLNRITSLKSENIELENSIEKLRKETESQDDTMGNCNIILERLKNFSDLVDHSTVVEKRKYINSIINTISVNGDTGKVHIKFKGGADL